MLDAVTIEILWSRITSIVDEAAKVIIRTSFSTLSNEANDFACVLTDAMGQSLAQNTGSIPSFIGTLPATVRHFLGEFGPDSPDGGMQDGDVYITNNPWQGTGHLPDVCVAKAGIPQRPAGRLCCRVFACARYRRHGALGRAARGVRGGAAHSADALHAEWRRRCDFDQAVAHQCTDARSDPGRYLGPGRRRRIDGETARHDARGVRPAGCAGVGRRAVFALRGRDAGCDPRVTGRHLPLRLRYGRSGRAVPFQTDADDPRRRDHRRLCRLVAAAAARHQLPADLYERGDRLRGEMRAAAEFAEQRRHVPPGNRDRTGRLDPQPDAAGRGRWTHGERALRSDAGLRRPIPDCTGAGDGGARLSALGRYAGGAAARAEFRDGTVFQWRFRGAARQGWCQ